MRTYTIVVEPEDTRGFMVSYPPCPAALPRARPSMNAASGSRSHRGLHRGLEADGEPVPQERATPQLLTVAVAAKRPHSRPRPRRVPSDVCSAPSELAAIGGELRPIETY